MEEKVEMEEKEVPEGLLLEKEYHIPLELFRKAFTAFQKKYVYPRSYLCMAVMLIAAGVYSYFVVTGSESDRPLYCMIVMVLLVLCALQWYNPRKIRRNLMAGVKEIEEDLYRLRVYPEYMEIGTVLTDAPAQDAELQEADALFEDTPEDDFSGTRIYYTKEIPVLEYPQFFMVYLKKRMFYVIPKAAFSEEELEIIRVHFSLKLGKSFISKV